MRGRWWHRFGALVGVIVAVFVLSTPVAWAGGPDNDDCADAPTPELTGRGLTGAIDPPTTNAAPKSIYADYSYAGQIWNLYDNVDDTLGVCFDPGGTIENWLGNQMFDVAKVVTAGANTLHHAINKGGLSDQVDGFIAAAAHKGYSGIGAPFIPLALIIMGIVVMRHTLSGDNRQVVGAGGRTLAMLFVVSMALSPLVYTAFADRMLFGGISDAQSKVLSALYGNARSGARPADIPPTKLHEAVVYRNWLRGEFGDQNDPMAKKFGRMLTDAQGYTVAQSRGDAAHDEHVKQNKEKEFVHVASEMHDKGDYASFTGRSGRVGSGAIAMIQGLTISLFTLGANASVLLAQLLLRAMVLFAPLIGFACLLPGRARTYARAGLTFMAIGFVMTVVTIFYTYVIGLIQSAGMPIGLELLCTTALTLFVWYFARPFKRLKDMATSMSDATGMNRHTTSMTEQMQKLWVFRSMRRTDQMPGNDRWWRQPGAVDPATGAPAVGGPAGAGVPDGERPEPAATVRAEGKPVLRREIPSVPTDAAPALPGPPPQGTLPPVAEPANRIASAAGAVHDRRPGVGAPVGIPGEAGVAGTIGAAGILRAESVRESPHEPLEQRLPHQAPQLAMATTAPEPHRPEFVRPSEILAADPVRPLLEAPRKPDGSYQLYRPSEDPKRPSDLHVQQPQPPRNPSGREAMTTTPATQLTRPRPPRQAPPHPPAFMPPVRRPADPPPAPPRPETAVRPIRRRPPDDRPPRGER